VETILFRPQGLSRAIFGSIIEVNGKIHERYDGQLRNTIGSILAMLLASLGATHLGYSIIGFLFFVLALTPLPSIVARRLRDLLI
jgi:uncharacterized membrane protein YhaH (DUF805 family)